MSKKFVCILCAMVLSSTALFTGCDLFKLQGETSSQSESASSNQKKPLSKDDEDSEESGTEEEVSSEEIESEDESSKEESEDESEDEESSSSKKNSTSTLSLSAESVKKYSAKELANVYGVYESENGLYYMTKDETYGLINMSDGSLGEAKYTYLSPLECTALDNDKQKNFLYEFTTKDPDKIVDVKDSNCYGILDSEGKEIVGEKYAYLEMLSDRYAYVVTATEYTDNEDEALLYTGGGIFSFPTEDSEYINGKWEIIDLETKKTVSGLGSTKPADVRAHGALIEVDDVYYNSEGKEVAVEDILSDDGYTTESGSTVTVMSTDGKKLFDFESSDGYITSFDDEHFLMYYSESSTYKIVDRKGKAVSGEFDTNPGSLGANIKFVSIYDSDLVPYTFEGEPIIDKTFKSCTIAENNNFIKLERAENDSAKAKTEITYLDADGNIVGQYIQDKESNSSYEAYGLDYISDDDEYKVCNLSTGEYSIKSEEYPEKALMFTFFDGKQIISTLDGKPVVSSEFETLTSSVASGYAFGISEDGSGELIKISY